MRPLVLVTADRTDAAPAPPGPRVRPVRQKVWIGEAYVAAVRAAGGLPLLVPPGETEVGALLARADALVLTGGHFDIHPSHYGEAVAGRIDRIEEDRTLTELALAAGALQQGLPVLGICGGMQALAVAAGGTLVQDLPGPPDALEHEQPTDPAQPWHLVHVQGKAAGWLGRAVVQANSTHHQAVRVPGVGLVASGWTEDGVVEVIEGTGPGFVLGVQWHPEILRDLSPYQALLQASPAR